MVNKVILLGNLGTDPEVRHLDTGVVVARFPIATNERYKDKSGTLQNKTEWHDVVVWRRLAEIAEQYLKKGSRIYLEGKLTHRKYQDKEGIERYATEVVADSFQMLGGRPENGENRIERPTAPPAEITSPKNETKPAEGTAAAPDPFAADDDLPF